MGELRRPVPPLARFLVVALGLLGFVAAPTGSTTQGGASSTGTISAVRTWVVQHTSARSRTSGKPRPGGHAQAPPVANTVAATATRQAVAADIPDAKPVPAALPAPGIEVRPPSQRAVRPAGAAPAEPGLAPAGVPRGRAPPASTRL